MYAIRQVVDGNALAQIVKLPKHMQSGQVEIIIMPAEQNRRQHPITRSQLEALLSGSNTEALTGSLPAEFDAEVEQIRLERRARHESFD